MENVKIVGCGYARASSKIENEALKKAVDTSDEWIQTRTGIASRYISETENTSDLAIRAAQKAIHNAQINTSQISMIIVATCTPDNVTPSVACIVQEALGLNDKPVMAFDINAACSGFLFALQCAASMLQKGYALVIGAETLSKILDWSDRNTCVLFGDGAGAVLIQRTQDGSTMDFYARSKGDKEYALYCAGRSLQPDLENVAQDKPYLSMNGREVFRFAIQAMPDAIYGVLQGQPVEEMDLMIPHQANIRILEYVSKKMKFPMEKMFVNLDQFGNTSAASVPIALAQAWEEHKIKENMDLVLVGFGAGFTWAACKIHIEGGKHQ
ncbi:beta-ketoacyl-ACP synthase III [Faecalicoccus pleomorphus]|uniref:beta-ketoacyl-ACP synthase III n=1 Tax=Faecalicoccus pleomorphus TaxID=1323 RepID=UPI00242EE238|nr:beta-ketoacyl-ACP synthase III [Faecalicoccus pleomorphus]